MDGWMEGGREEDLRHFLSSSAQPRNPVNVSEPKAAKHLYACQIREREKEREGAREGEGARGGRERYA